MHTKSMVLPLLALCLLASACRSDADEASDAEPHDGSAADATPRTDVGPARKDHGTVRDVSVDATITVDGSPTPDGAAPAMDGSPRLDGSPVRDGSVPDGAPMSDGTAPVLDAVPVDAAQPDGGTVAAITAPSIEFLCVSPLQGVPQPWRLRLRLGYGEVAPGATACEDYDVQNPDGEFRLTLEWGPELEQSRVADVVSGAYCLDDCEPVTGTVTFSQLDADALRARGDVTNPGPVPGPVASGVFEGVWVETGGPLVIPFEDADGCLAVIVDLRCDGAP